MRWNLLNSLLILIGLLTFLLLTRPPHRKIRNDRLLETVDVWQVRKHVQLGLFGLSFHPLLR